MLKFFFLACCCFRVSAERNLHLRIKTGLEDAEIMSAGVGKSVFTGCRDFNFASSQAAQFVCEKR